MGKKAKDPGIKIGKKLEAYHRKIARLSKRVAIFAEKECDTLTMAKMVCWQAGKVLGKKIEGGKES